MTALEFVACTFSPRLADGRYIFRPWGKWGPCYLLTRRQRTARAWLQSAFYLVSVGALMFTDLVATIKGGLTLATAFLLGGYAVHALFTIGLPRTEAPAPYTPEQRDEAVREYSQQVGTPMLRALQIVGGVGMMISIVLLLACLIVRERELFVGGMAGLLLFGPFTALMTWQLKLSRKRG